jgi:hypothetical protein
MITLKEWMEVVDYRITEGGDYQWGCFGHNAYSLDSWNGEQDGHSFTIIFDTKTQEVYEVQAHDYVHQRAYRLINSVYADQYRTEAKDRSMLENQAWDDVDYVDLETDDDWMQKAIAIAAGEDYDTRVSVPLDLPDDLLLEAALNAHRQGITLNDYINNALMAVLEEYKRDPEGMKAKTDRWKTDYDIT